jgi:hypothetical protein
MIETVGEFYEKKNASDKIKTDPKQTSPLTRGKKEEENQFEDIFLHITGLKNTVSNRVRFMILDMEELRANNWKPRGGDKCPKTVDAVQKSVQKFFRQRYSIIFFIDLV